MLILNSKDSEGRTALHLYVAVDNRKLVRYLTSREDCLLSEQDHMQRTPLHLAAILGMENLLLFSLFIGSGFASHNEIHLLNTFKENYPDSYNL